MTTTTRRKYPFVSRAEAEQAYNRASSEATVTSICLNALLGDQVTWYTQGAYRVGMVRPDSATGGYVIVQYRYAGQEYHACCYYLDAWTSATRTLLPNVGDQEAMDLYELAIRVRQKRDKIAGY